MKQVAAAAAECISDWVDTQSGGGYKCANIHSLAWPWSMHLNKTIKYESVKRIMPFHYTLVIKYS